MTVSFGGGMLKTDLLGPKLRLGNAFVRTECSCIQQAANRVTRLKAGASEVISKVIL